MALTPRDVINFRELWKKLQLASGVSNPTEFPLELFITTAPITDNYVYYVNPVLGNDGNAGIVSDAPLATLTAAIAKLPKTITAPTTVNLAAGTYNETILIEGFDIRAGASLTFTGTTGLYVPATGNSSGTVTSVTAATTSALSFITDSSQNLPVNALRGKYVKITSGGSSGIYRQIATNTATTISLTSTTGLAGAVTYEIHDLLTIIQGTAAGGTPNAQFAVANVHSTGSQISGPTMPAVIFNQLTIQSTGAGTAVPCRVTNVDNINFNNCTINHAVVQALGVNTLLMSNVARSQLLGCFFTRTSASGAMVSFTNCGAINPNGCYFYGPGGSGSFTTSLVSVSGMQSFVGAACLIEKTDAAGTILNLNGVQSGSWQTNCWLWNTFASGGGVGSTGMNVSDADATRSNGNTLMSFSLFAVKGVETGVNLTRSGTTVIIANGRMDDVTTIGFSINRGAQLQVPAFTFGTVTTNEIRIDGTNSTMAALTAASPQVISSGYFSSITR